MSRVWIRRYVPLYIAFAVTGIVMAFLFLRPEAALGLTVEVKAVPKFEGFAAGFKLVDPGTGQPETVVVEAEVVLPEGDFEAINLATLDIFQSTGDPGFIDFFGSGVNPAVNLPLPVGPNFNAIVFQELTTQLPVDGTGDIQGLLFVDVSLVQAIPDALGYGYGYRGGQGGGSIKFTFRYIPPAIAGTYNATIRVSSVTGAELAASAAQFIVLPPFPAGSVVAASTIYPRSAGEALTRDLVVLQAKISDDVASRLVSLEVDPDLLNPNKDTMDSISEFHPSILAKWGVDPGVASHLLPMEIIPQAQPLTGLFSASIKAVDIAGQEVLLTGANGAQVNVVNTRSSFNIYVMPGANSISTPLQCSTGDCTGDEFNLDTLLDQVYGNAKAGSTTSGDVVEAVWYYCPEIVSGDLTTTNCPSGSAPGSFIGFTPPGPSNLTTAAAGKGYILIAKDAAFEKNLDATDTQFPTTSVPVPIKFTIVGEVTVAPPPAIPPGTVVKAVWNLVGLHSERDSVVGNLVQAVDSPTRLWLQLFAFANTVDILMDSNGNVVRDPQGKPLISVEQGFFQNVTFNRDNEIPAGSGLWLEMCGGSNAECVSNEIGPVLEP